jgi:hypothetical protein
MLQASCLSHFSANNRVTRTTLPFTATHPLRLPLPTRSLAIWPVDESKEKITTQRPQRSKKKAWRSFLSFSVDAKFLLTNGVSLLQTSQ